MTSYVLLPLQKNSKKLAFQGYIYTKDKSKWRCEQKNKDKCPGRCRIENEIISITQNYNHLPDLGYVEMQIKIFLIIL